MKKYIIEVEILVQDKESIGDYLDFSSPDNIQLKADACFMDVNRVIAIKEEKREID
jgi:hypothetical protein